MARSQKAWFGLFVLLALVGWLIWPLTLVADSSPPIVVYSLVGDGGGDGGVVVDLSTPPDLAPYIPPAHTPKSSRCFWSPALVGSDGSTMHAGLTNISPIYNACEKIYCVVNNNNVCDPKASVHSYTFGKLPGYVASDCKGAELLFTRLPVRQKGEKVKFYLNGQWRTIARQISPMPSDYYVSYGPGICVKKSIFEGNDPAARLYEVDAAPVPAPAPSTTEFTYKWD